MFYLSHLKGGGGGLLIVIVTEENRCSVMVLVGLDVFLRGWACGRCSRLTFDPALAYHVAEASGARGNGLRDGRQAAPTKISLNLCVLQLLCSVSHRVENIGFTYEEIIIW